MCPVLLGARTNTWLVAEHDMASNMNQVPHCIKSAKVARGTDTTEPSDRNWDPNFQSHDVPLHTKPQYSTVPGGHYNFIIFTDGFHVDEAWE